MCGSNQTQLDGFTPEQQQYLENLIQRLDLQAVFSNPPVDEPVPVTVHGTPYEDLCKEELAKHETHPWDLWTKMSRHATDARMPEGTDAFMFKHHGMFNVAPAQPGYMCRLRIPACRLRGDQLAMLGDLAEELAGGYAHITTRGNLQVREIQPENLIAVLQRLYDIGLTSKGSGADSVRNITASPWAGFDPEEVIDLTSHALALHHHILNSRDLHGIPRKFNISFDNGGTVSCVSDTNDIAFLATEVLPNESGVEPGVYCRVLVGGITGHGDFARDTGYLVRPEDTVAVSDAILRVFIEHGDRTNRKKARLKYVLDRYGDEWYIRRSQEKLDEAGHGIRFFALPADACAPRKPIDRQAHIGIHPQSQPGLYSVGVALNIGKLSPDQLRGLGEIAQLFGQNDIRLTVWQNLIIPGIREQDLNAAVAEIESLGLQTSASSFAAGAVACTGRFGCKFASSHTKSHAAQLVDYLQERFELDQPINIHLTGCPHSCAQHYIGDIGLLGASTEDGQEAYHVFLGGGSDLDQGIARRLTGPVPADLLPALLEHVVRVYLEQREPDESFVTFTRRQSDDRLAALFLEAVVA